MRRPAYRGSGDYRQRLAGHQPVEQMAQRGEALLDARRRKRLRLLLDPGGNVQRLHGCDRRHTAIRAPR